MSSGKRRKVDNKRRKKEAEKRTDEKEATKLNQRKKKRVTAGEVDKLGKELGNCTHRWTTNYDTNTQALSTLSRLKVKEER